MHAKQQSHALPKELAKNISLILYLSVVHMSDYIVDFYFILFFYLYYYFFGTCPGRDF